MICWDRIVLVGLFAVHTHARRWVEAPRFSCPANSEARCYPAQENGYDWEGLRSGPFEKYGSNTFQGFTYSALQRDQSATNISRLRSGFITTNLDRSPTMSIDGETPFVVDRIELATGHDAEIVFHYTMPDGSTCVEVAEVLEKGSTIRNVQCGGATSVMFKPGRHTPPATPLSIFSISFHCEPPAVLATASTTATRWQEHGTRKGPVFPAIHNLSYPVFSHPSGHMSHSGGGGDESRAVIGPRTNSTRGSCSGGSYEHVMDKTSEDVACTSSSTDTSAPRSAYGRGGTPITTCPRTEQPGGLLSSQHAISDASCLPVATMPSATSRREASTSPSPSWYPFASDPDVLPRCLNTWLFTTGCRDNTDVDCFCQQEHYMVNAMGCVNAWSASDEEVGHAAAYLMSICADHTEFFPAILQACPATISPAQMWDLPDDVTATTSRARWVTVVVSMDSPSSPSKDITLPVVEPTCAVDYATMVATTITVPRLRFATATIAPSHDTVAPVTGRYTSQRHDSTEGYRSWAHQWMNGSTNARSSGTATPGTAVSGSGARHTAITSIVPAIGGAGRVWTSATRTMMRVGFVVMALLHIHGV
ncbi:uncharacterized protein LTR77_010993 [Saxophila tyrrhenica]|uniref:CFEM domain-containing protein n=1 Tax=Saxophila tyrrhenica TaxID=1690608 RepID=A0AAV9NXR0_9PEZI|nr:hypothetical protein LTR77_010993 [Saxophila tyrrhenica]